MFTTFRQDLQSYVNKICLCVTTVHGHVPSRCYHDLDACRKHVDMSEGVFSGGWGGGGDRSPQWEPTGADGPLNHRRTFITRVLDTR